MYRQAGMADRHLRKMKRRRVWKKNLALFTLALPALLHVIIFQYIPMPGIVIAFKDYKPFKGILGSVGRISLKRSMNASQFSS